MMSDIYNIERSSFYVDTYQILRRLLWTSISSVRDFSIYNGGGFLTTGAAEDQNLSSQKGPKGLCNVAWVVGIK